MTLNRSALIKEYVSHRDIIMLYVKLRCDISICIIYELIYLKLCHFYDNILTNVQK